MKSSWHVGYSTVGLAVFEVCDVNVAECQDEVLKTPADEEEWIAVAQCFEERWNLLYSLGALDGKH